MMEIAWVTERISVGTAIETSVDVAVLLKAGVNLVINCRSEVDDEPLLSDTDITYVWHGTPDWDIKSGRERTPIPAKWYTTGAAVVLQGLTHSSTRAYIHCKNGWYRSPLLVYATLRALGIRSDWAKGLIILARHQAVAGLEVASAEADAAIAGGW